jgi:hypothetical protein
LGERRTTPVTRALLASLLFVMTGCASGLVTPARVDEVPMGTYRVTVVPGRPEYRLILFELPSGRIELPVAEAAFAGVDTPERYQSALQAGLLIYELQDSAGVVRGYLAAAASQAVIVQTTPWTGGGLVITIGAAAPTGQHQSP